MCTLVVSSWKVIVGNICQCHVTPHILSDLLTKNSVHKLFRSCFSFFANIWIRNQSQKNAIAEKWVNISIGKELKSKLYVPPFDIESTRNLFAIQMRSLAHFHSALVLCVCLFLLPAKRISNKCKSIVPVVIHCSHKSLSHWSKRRKKNSHKDPNGNSPHEFDMFARQQFKVNFAILKLSCLVPVSIVIL